MAISRGAGTEILRCASFEEIDGATSTIIYGVQHHIYTVLSVLFYSQAIQAAGNYVNMRLVGYDSKGGTTAQSMYIFRHDMNQQDTFVWDTKFSFNGFEPTDFVGPLDDATKQDAIADQGSSVPQQLVVYTEHADDNFDVHLTYIDQNNA